MNSKSKLGWFLRAGASLVAIGAASPAFAQDQPAPDDVSEEIVVTATGRTAAIQDVPIAVTALGGDQIENSGAQDLRDLTQLAPSLEMGTGQSNSSGTTARIRGIGTGSDNPGFEAAVGIFIDGVYRARAGAALADLPELERVEVLRGPQGTLFGRNTSAGAISVVTAGPEFEPGMNLEASYGFDDLHETGAKAGINVPLGDSFAVRVDGSIRARDGYIVDLISGDDINDRNRWTGRAQALWDISPDASFRFIVDASETSEVCCGVTPLIYGSTQGVISLLTAGAGTPAIDVEGRGMTVTPGRSYGEDTEEIGYSGQLDWDLGFANLTSITAYRDWDATRDQDVDFNLIDIAYRDGLEVGFENFTQELRLQGEAGRLDWLVGLFYGDETLDTTDTIRVGATKNAFTNIATIGATTAAFGTPCELYNFTANNSIFQCAVGLLPAILQPGAIAAVNSSNGGYILPDASGDGQQADHWVVDTESLALFTHNEFNITDQLVLTVGVRYSQETKDLSANLASTGSSCPSLQAMETATAAAFAPATGGGGVVTFLQQIGAAQLMNLACNPAINTIADGSWTGDSEENEWSGTASLAYHLNDDMMVYGGYSRGYKAGGFNVDRSGFSLFPNTTSSASLSTDQLHFDPEFTDSLEVGLRSNWGPDTTVNVTAFYQEIHDYQLNAFNGFNFITQNIPEAISQGAELEVATRPIEGLSLTAGLVYTDAFYDTTVVFNPVDPVPNTVNAGDPFSFAPEWVATTSISYEMPIGGDLRALFYLDGRWNSEYRTQTLNREPTGATDNDSFAVFNGRIGIGPESEHWAVEFWGRNLFDEFYYVGAFSPPLQNSTVIYPNEPQTYGITLRLRH